MRPDWCKKPLDTLRSTKPDESGFYRFSTLARLLFLIPGDGKQSYKRER